LTSLPDALGLLGVLLVLIAYAGGALGRLDPARPPALLLNIAGAVLILVSLAYDFNLSAFVMESLWALVGVVGLVRVLLKPKA
jgi:O-antigen ligase